MLTVLTAAVAQVVRVRAGRRGPRPRPLQMGLPGARGSGGLAADRRVTPAAAGSDLSPAWLSRILSPPATAPAVRRAGVCLRVGVTYVQDHESIRVKTK